MTKILVVCGLGRHWDYSTYEVTDELGDKVEAMLENGVDPKTIEDLIRNESIKSGFGIPPRSKEAEKWYHMDNFDMLLVVEEW